MSIFWTILGTAMVAATFGFLVCGILSAGSDADDAMDVSVAFSKGKEAGLEEARRERFS
jgi:hypothetical protein